MNDKDAKAATAAMIKQYGLTQLPEHISKKLGDIPESGMGYQFVNLVMRDGSYLKTTVIGCEAISENIDPNNIIDVLPGDAPHIQSTEMRKLVLDDFLDDAFLSQKQLPYDLAVFVGRFQIFHNGHLHVIKEALKQAKTVLVVIGSAGEARRPDWLPFTAEERREMIVNSLSNNTSDPNNYEGCSEKERVIIKFAEDYGNMTLWTEQIQRLATEALEDDENPFQLRGNHLKTAKIALAGYAKDNSSYYLKEFPQWDSINVLQKHILSSSDIRKEYFRKEYFRIYEEFLPRGTINFLKKFEGSPEFNSIVAELEFMEKYLNQWKDSPYPPNFVTVDNVVIQGGHVLLIQRKANPGKDLWALPGGHLDHNETVDQGTIRELREETKLKVPESVLRGSIVATKYFDNPFRSMRKRTITFATLFHLQPKVGQLDKFETEEEYRKRAKITLALPKVFASDDAKRAMFVRLDTIRREELFEDHWQIIQTMISLIRD